MKHIIEISIDRFLFVFLLLCLGIFTFSQAAAQDRTRLKAYYSKSTDGTKNISVILTTGRGKDLRGVSNAPITISSIARDSIVEITTIYTDNLGESILMVEAGYEFARNEEGFAVINLVFNGNDSLRNAKRKIEFKDLDLQLDTQVIDSVKTVSISASVVDLDGNSLGVEDLKMKVGVSRLHSVLFLGESVTNEEGTAVFEFPDDIPGDANGTITVVTLIEDDDDFGTVRKEVDVQWGLPVDYSLSATDRSLYGDSAPLWMIFSVAIILLGAWGHFIWAILLVFKIKKLE